MSQMYDITIDYLISNEMSRKIIFCLIYYTSYVSSYQDDLIKTPHSQSWRIQCGEFKNYPKIGLFVMLYFTTNRKVGKLWQAFINVAKLGPTKCITMTMESKRQYLRVDSKRKLKQKIRRYCVRMKCCRGRISPKKECCLQIIWRIGRRCKRMEPFL